MVIAIDPHLVVTSETSLDDVVAARQALPRRNPLFLAMDSSWWPSWRPEDTEASVHMTPDGVIICVWEDREQDSGPDGDDGMPWWLTTIAA